jgi:hypothetical protein
VTGHPPLAAVSAGLLAPKKGDHPFARLHCYMNYGLVGLATTLTSAGHDTTVFHGRFDAPEALATRLLELGMLDQERPVLLSLPSVFAIEWAQRFCTEVKRLVSGSRIIAGGRWTVGDNTAWIAAKLPEVTRFVSGTADDSIVDIVASAIGGWKPANSADVPVTGGMPASDMMRVHDGQLFHPSLEVSRGCGMGCLFCAESTAALSGMKSVPDCVAELRRHSAFYDSNEFHPYFEASFFRPTSAWATSLADRLDAEGLRLHSS